MSAWTMQVRGAPGAVATLALKLPKGGVASVADVAKLAGAACEVLTYDVIAQESGPRMAMSEWCAGLPPMSGTSVPFSARRAQREPMRLAQLRVLGEG